jgi:hypothetical protein
MGEAGVEPAPLAGQDPKSCVAASYTTRPTESSSRIAAGGSTLATSPYFRSAIDSNSAVPSVSGANSRPGPNGVTAAAGAASAAIR